jgi:hypothetical protein
MIAHQGGQVAAPVFRRIMNDSLRHLGVPAERAPANTAALAHTTPVKVPSAPPTRPHETSQAANSRIAVGPGETLVPNLFGRPARQAVLQARQAMLEVSLHGSGVVSAQQPMPGAVVQRGSRLSLELTSPTPELPAPPLASDLAQVVPPVKAGNVTAVAPPVPESGRRGQDG